MIESSMFGDGGTAGALSIPPGMLFGLAVGGTDDVILFLLLTVLGSSDAEAGVTVTGEPGSLLIWTVCGAVAGSGVETFSTVAEIDGLGLGMLDTGARRGSTGAHKVLSIAAQRAE